MLINVKAPGMLITKGIAQGMLSRLLYQALQNVGLLHQAC